MSSSTGGGRKRKGGPGSGCSATQAGRLVAAFSPQTIDVAAAQPGHRGCNLETFVVLSKTSTHVSLATEGGEMHVANSIFEYNTYRSPDQISTTVQCSKTKVVEVMHGVGGRLFWVAFVADNDGHPARREMYCRMRGKCDTIFGMSQVHEQQVSTNEAGKRHITYRVRQVDHRELLELRFNGVHYTVKGGSKKLKAAAKAAKMVEAASK